MKTAAKGIGWRWAFSALLVSWVVAICVVWWSMTAYSFQIDGEPTPIAAWPSDAAVSLAADRPTVLLFLHPRCPCSAASLTELESALAAIPSDRRPQVQVIAAVPTKHDSKWTESPTVVRSQELPNSSLLIDVGGFESHKFGAASSGHVMAFAPTGELRYSGGVTLSRGHAGDNVGRMSLIRTLADGTTDDSVVEEFPVFGCRLCLPDSRCVEKAGVAASSAQSPASPR